MKSSRHPVVFYGFLGLLVIAIGFAIAGAVQRTLVGCHLGTAGITVLLAFCFYVSAQTLYGRRGKRLATCLALALVTAAWVLGFLLIWNTRFDWFTTAQVENIAICLLLLLPLSLPMILGASLVASPRWRSTGWCMTAAFSAIWLVIMLAPWLDWSPPRLLAILLPLASSSILFALLLPSTGVPIWSRIVGMVLSVGVAAITVVFLCDNDFEFDLMEIQRYRLGTIVFLGYSLATILACLNALMVPPLERGGWLRWATFASLVITVGLVYTGLQLTLNETLDFDLTGFFSTAVLYTRLGIASLIVTIAGLIAFGFAVRTSYSGSGPDAGLLITLICPRCRASISLAQGEQPCPECELKFSIRVEDPQPPRD
ncbi:MAG: hypothetical protein CMJ22_01970 [Phycisphaerae bacterium]|nr:hypothetical protein [Phycisphaerae bacterium]